jgi:hypothetical protein
VCASLPVACRVVCGVRCVACRVVCVRC